MNVCEFSSDHRYRYTLWRRWADRGSAVMFVGLNPSTADETKNDPTVRRCISFAKSWGFKAMCMTNIFAFRATLPAVMRNVPDPVGLDNDYWLSRVAKQSQLVVFAWGSHGTHQERDLAVIRLLSDVKAPTKHFGFTDSGTPRHPLYLRKDAPLLNFPTRNYRG